MAFLGRQGVTAPLTSADIPDSSITASKIATGAITAADVAADMATQAELDLKAPITNAALVTPNLGTPSAGVVTNLSGVLPVGVTGGSGLTALGTVTAGNLSNTAIVYPTGSINLVAKHNIENGGLFEESSDSQGETIAFASVSFPAISGRIYIIETNFSTRPVHLEGTSVGASNYLWYGTSSKTAGSTDFSNSTKLVEAFQGRNLITSTSTDGAHGYYTITLNGYFTAASTATHYTFIGGNGSSNTNCRICSATNVPWNTFIYEVMP